MLAPAGAAPTTQEPRTIAPLIIDFVGSKISLVGVTAAALVAPGRATLRRKGIDPMHSACSTGAMVSKSRLRWIN